MLKKLQTIWQKHGLDIRQTGNGRWLDQKVTPDVLSAICDAISGFLSRGGQSFTIKDLWESDEFIRTAQQDFGKPHPQHPGARSEYDKFVGQPVNTLAAAYVLDAKGSNPAGFSVAKNMGDVIHQMAGSERKAIEFLDAYISESMRQSGMSPAFDNFLEGEQTPESFSRLKGDYVDFIIGNTLINGETECRRVFPKALNVLAYCRQKQGSIGGHLSKHPIVLPDIRYNRLNFRDIATKKPKHVPREQHEENACLSPKRDGGRTSRFDRRVINDIKHHHNYQPEIEDEYSATPGAVEGHHIFPRSQYPALSQLRENIILLTPTQHEGHAHAESVRSVSEYYQHFCLQKKLDVIKKCESDPNCYFYSFRAFKEMLFSVGIIPDVKKLTSLKPDSVLRIMCEHYHGLGKRKQ